jgi:uncharacterized membrane protein
MTPDAIADGNGISVITGPIKKKIIFCPIYYFGVVKIDSSLLSFKNNKVRDFSIMCTALL